MLVSFGASTLLIHQETFAYTTRALGYGRLPDEVDASMLDFDDFLRCFHQALLEIHIQEGTFIYLETSHRFPINKGIPNYLLFYEDEV